METLIQLFTRDLNRLSEEMAAFKNQKHIWEISGDIANSAGNLTLHLIGNLNHFVGAIIGATGYTRDRDAEFNDKDVEIGKLLNMILETRNVVNTVLSNFDEKKLLETFPMQLFGYKMTYEYFLIHLLSHLNYHLGQINYLRRILEN